MVHRRPRRDARRTCLLGARDTQSPHPNRLPPISWNWETKYRPGNEPRTLDGNKPCAPSASRTAVMNERLARLDQALRCLTPRQEQVIRLRNEWKLSFDEAAIALDCSAIVAQKLWTRAINELTHMMRCNGIDQR